MKNEMEKKLDNAIGQEAGCLLAQNFEIIT